MGTYKDGAHEGPRSCHDTYVGVLAHPSRTKDVAAWAMPTRRKAEPLSITNSEERKGNTLELYTTSKPSVHEPLYITSSIHVHRFYATYCRWPPYPQGLTGREVLGEEDGLCGDSALRAPQTAGARRTVGRRRASYPAEGPCRCRGSRTARRPGVGRVREPRRANGDRMTSVESRRWRPANGCPLRSSRVCLAPVASVSDARMSGEAGYVHAS